MLISALTVALLTSASADFSFIGDMIKDMTKAAKDIKSNVTEINSSDNNRTH